MKMNKIDYKIGSIILLKNLIKVKCIINKTCNFAG